MGIAHLLMWHALSQLNSFTCFYNQPFLQKFQKISHNQPNFEIFPIKLVSLNKSCILRSHWCQNHLKMSNPSDFPKISQFCKNEPKQPFTAVCGDFHVSRIHFSESSGLFAWKYLDPVFYHIGPQEIPGKFKNVPKLAQIPN